MKKRRIALYIIIAIVGIMGLWIMGFALNWFGEAASVAQEEFGPRELLRKYEWFKDAAANLDAIGANIVVYNTRLSSLKEDYGNTPRSKWDRTDKEQMNLWTQEVAGIRAAYNDLAAEYNAQMAKFNWRFCNKGDLPEGASIPLPREFKPYVEG